MHIRECVDCYIRPWKAVEFCQRHFSSSCLLREPRCDKGVLTPSICQQEFEIDREYYSLDETLTYKVSQFCNIDSLKIKSVINLLQLFVNRVKVARQVADSRLQVYHRFHHALIH